MEARLAESQIKLAAQEGGFWDREDFLAHARLVLAVVCTIAVCLNPGSFERDVNASQLLILIYLIYSLFYLIVVRIRRMDGMAGWVSLHAVEVVITFLITMFTGGDQSFFLGLYLFVLLAAACKWGFHGALLTSGAYIALLVSDLTLSSSWFGSAHGLMREHSSLIATMVLSATLVSTAGFLGLLMEREKKRYGDAVIISRFVRNAIPEPSFRAAIGSILISVREYFDADLVRLAIQEIRGEQANAWDATRLAGKSGKGVQSWKLTESARRASFAMPPEEVRRSLGLGPGGRRRSSPSGRRGGP